MTIRVVCCIVVVVIELMVSQLEMCLFQNLDFIKKKNSNFRVLPGHVTMVSSPEEADIQRAIRGVQRRQRDGIHRCKRNDDKLDIYVTKDVDFHDKRILIVRTFLWLSIKIDR